ncbi:MAG: hypothetical protein A2Z38_00010 [Planctomycetes bacterium RBG_19FT_COMBO_48_8]|nr:MAG: hypothetical protein A2Z38_00010 [Planctomycetes bacterium RBG_19FT_COMBO_48_8]
MRILSSLNLAAKAFIDLFLEIVGIPSCYYAHYTNTQAASCILWEFLTGKEYFLILLRLQPLKHSQIRKIAAGTIDFMKNHAVDCRIATNATDNLAKSLPFLLFRSSFDILYTLDNLVSLTLCPFTISLVLGFEAVAFALLA